MSKLVPFNKTEQAALTPFSNMLDDFFSDRWFPARIPDLEAFRLDVKEDDKTYTIEAEVPGTKKENISLRLEHGRLTIGVEGKEHVKSDNKKVVHQERRYSYMERSIYLADAAENGAKATLDNGELVITIPKQSPDAAARKIQIE